MAKKDLSRRLFLQGTLSSLGVSLFSNSSAQSPCSPRISGAATNPVCPAPASGSIFSDQSGIDTGEWAFSIALPADIAPFDISWQNRTAYWDPVRDELHFMGKPQLSAGGGSRSPHWIFSESNGTWRRTTNAASPNKGGHVWIVTFDAWDDVGDYYYVEQEVHGTPDVTRTIRRMNRSVENGNGIDANAWELLSEASFRVWEPTATPNPGMGYHPNLLGEGRPGIFCWGTTGFSYWDKSNDEWVQVAGFGLSAPYGNRRLNTSLYVPGLDTLVFGSGTRQGQNMLIIPSSYDGNPTPRLENLPIGVHGGTVGAAHMLLDPRNDSSIMLLERQGTRVWTNSNGGDAGSWVLESFSHPFWENLPVLSNDAGSWTCCSVSELGVVIGMATHGSASSNGVGGSIMWRPG